MAKTSETAATTEIDIVHVQNFVSAVRIVCGRRTGLTVKGKKLFEASGVKAAGFPRTQMALFYENLMSAERLGLLQLLRDGDCLWVVC